MLTGSTGFLGEALAKELESLNINTRYAVRRGEGGLADNYHIVGNIDEETKYTEALAGVDTVIHLAARAHIMKDDSSNPLEEYRKVNVAGSENLARQAAIAGVKRFIYVSSVKVNGESTTNTQAYNESMLPTPEDAYGVSKYEAEQVLQKVSVEYGMELVVVRPPLIYGPGVKANFKSLLSLSAKSLLLPFGMVKNQRSMVYIGNLVDFIIKCIDAPNAANETFLVSDGQDVSLRSLVKLIRESMGMSSRLFPMPVFLFKLVGRLLGKESVVDRLVGDLQVDSSKARRLLNWSPPYSVRQGISHTVSWFNDWK